MRKKCIWVLMCFGLVVSVLGHDAQAANVIVNHENWNHYADVTDDVRAQVATLKIFFAHASVGGNMVSGMEDLHSENSTTYMIQNTSDDASPPSATEEGVMYDYSRGNPGWAEKVSLFENYISNGWHADSVDMVINKFCYIDQSADWETYRDSMLGLESSYPSTIFVYMTIPIKTAENSVSGWLRQQFNENLRTWIASQDNKYLLDIADIEAYSPTGVEQTSSYNDNTYQIMYASYSSDGGHLNSTGRVRMAKAMYSLLALTVDSSETTLPDTDQVYIWQHRRNGKTAFWRIAETGKLVSSNYNKGWGYVSESLTLSSHWNLGGLTTISDQNVLFWQNGSNGKVAYWTLNDSYQLTDETQDSGWGYVSDEIELDSAWSLVKIITLDSSKFLLWQNQSNGKVAWWKLGADSCKIANNTQDDGWGYVSDSITLDSSWRLADSLEQDGSRYLLWQKESNGKVAWWKIDSSCKLANETQNDGWGYVCEELTLKSAWTLAGAVSLSSTNMLIWQNRNKGKVAWWKLNTNGCTLVSSEQGNGWGWVSENNTLNSSWRLAAITSLQDTPALVWQKQSNGKVAWWKLDNSGTLVDETEDSGWGFASDEVTLNSSWTLSGVIR